MSTLSIRDLDLKGKRVFMRVDFNVPLAPETREITSDKRIRASLPSIEYALQHGAALILASHLGRPKGKPNPEMSLTPVSERLAGLLGRGVAMAPDCVGPAVEAMLPKPGGVLLLENLRFHPEEEKNDPEFSRQLAALCDVYVNDAFGSAHRAHASTAGMIPFVKQDKIDVIQNLMKFVDRLLIGGAMAYTFLRARGESTGKSLVEEDKVDLARELLAGAGDRLLLPVDHVAAAEMKAGVESRVSERVPDAMMGLDIGPQTIKTYSGVIAGAKTIIWNGPMGVFEMPPFDRGTVALAKAVAASGAVSVVGGGDSEKAINSAGVADKISHISTGGGASLEFLAGLELPGVAALERHG